MVQETLIFAKSTNKVELTFLCFFFSQQTKMAEEGASKKQKTFSIQEASNVEAMKRVFPFCDKEVKLVFSLCCKSLNETFRKERVNALKLFNDYREPADVSLLFPFASYVSQIRWWNVFAVWPALNCLTDISLTIKNEALFEQLVLKCVQLRSMDIELEPREECAKSFPTHWFPSTLDSIALDAKGRQWSTAVDFSHCKLLRDLQLSRVTHARVEGIEMVNALHLIECDVSLDLPPGLDFYGLEDTELMLVPKNPIRSITLGTVSFSLVKMIEPFFATCTDNIDLYNLGDVRFPDFQADGKLDIRVTQCENVAFGRLPSQLLGLTCESCGHVSVSADQPRFAHLDSIDVDATQLDRLDDWIPLVRSCTHVSIAGEFQSYSYEPFFASISPKTNHLSLIIKGSEGLHHTVCNLSWISPSLTYFELTDPNAFVSGHVLSTHNLSHFDVSVARMHLKLENTASLTSLTLKAQSMRQSALSNSVFLSGPVGPFLSTLKLFLQPSTHTLLIDDVSWINPKPSHAVSWSLYARACFLKYE
jgi:hypothetical protein